MSQPETTAAIVEHLQESAKYMNASVKYTHWYNMVGIEVTLRQKGRTNANQALDKLSYAIEEIRAKSERK